MIAFYASIISGLGEGKKLGFPTFNFDVSTVPDELGNGVYRCNLVVEESVFLGALHYGPVTIFGVTEPTLEVHILDYADSLEGLKEAEIRVFEKVRDVRDFEDEAALKEAIAEDIRKIRG
jgi:riboflavin kinase / FMN adenylyltransferase